MTQPSFDDAPSPTPFPRLSEDWRFLLPIPQGGRALILCRAWDDIPRAFPRLGIRTVAWFADPNASLSPDAPPVDGFLASWRAWPFPPASFDLILAPRGIPPRLGGLAAVLEALRPLLRPGGTLLLGAANRLCLIRSASNAETCLSPGRVARLLRRSGYASVELYGVMPDLDVPEYIFPLSPHMLAFALRNRYRRRLPFRWPGWIAHPFLAMGFLPFLPAWYVLASVPDDVEGWR